VDDRSTPSDERSIVGPPDVLVDPVTSWEGDTTYTPDTLTDSHGRMQFGADNEETTSDLIGIVLDDQESCGLLEVRFRPFERGTTVTYGGADRGNVAFEDADLPMALETPMYPKLLPDASARDRTGTQSQQTLSGAPPLLDGSFPSPLLVGFCLTVHGFGIDPLAQASREPIADRSVRGRLREVVEFAGVGFEVEQLIGRLRVVDVLVASGPEHEHPATGAVGVIFREHGPGPIRWSLAGQDRPLGDTPPRWVVGDPQGVARRRG
jgi:hypothetical protein